MPLLQPWLMSDPLASRIGLFKLSSLSPGLLGAARGSKNVGYVGLVNEYLQLKTVAKKITLTFVHLKIYKCHSLGKLKKVLLADMI